MSPLLQKDYFLSFRPKSGAASQILSYRAFGTHIKTLARQFQLDPNFFSCYSLRVGGASLLRAAGASDGFIMLMGRWKSLPACLGYQENSTSAQDMMMQMLTSRDLFTERDIALASTLIPQVTDAAVRSQPTPLH